MTTRCSQSHGGTPSEGREKERKREVITAYLDTVDRSDIYHWQALMPGFEMR